MATTHPNPWADVQDCLTGRFTLQRKLGQGGMGVVYLARDVALDRRVAIKVLRARYGRDTKVRERFLREARTAGGLSHPNIVSIHAAEEHGDLLLFIMDSVHGVTLNHAVRRNGPLAADRALGVGRDIAAALAYAHDRGVVHRDIKPENIMLEDESGRVMVTDFGIAKRTGDATLTGSGELVGTPAYMSPEQVRGEPVSGQSDLYALGGTLFFALCGRPPFAVSTLNELLGKHLLQTPQPISELRTNLPAPLVEVVNSCLAKEPRHRPRSAREIVAALEGSHPLPRPTTRLGRWLGGLRRG